MKNRHIVWMAACLLLAGLTASPAAQEITFSSSWSSRPVIRIAQDFFLGAGERVSDVRLVFGNATIEGEVDGDVVVVLGSLRMTGTAVVEGSIAVIGGSAEFGSGVSVERDIVVVGGTLTGDGFSRGGDQVVVGSRWLGDALSGVVPWMTRGLIWGRLIVPDLEWVWAMVGIFFVVYLALVIVFRDAVDATARTIATRPVSAFMTGLLVLLLLAPVIALLMATVVGLLLVPFVICAAVAAGLLGKAAVLRAMGGSFVRGDEDSAGRTLLAFIVGFALLTLAYMVPVLGFVAWSLTSVLGLGAATSTLRGMLRRERPQPPAPATPPAPPAPPADGPGRPGEPVPAPALMPSYSPASEPDLPLRSDAAEPAPYEPPKPPPPPPVAPAAPSGSLHREGLAKYPRASFFDRLAAFALDCVLVAIAMELLDWDRYEGLYMMMLLGYHIAFWAWRGTTMGGIIIGLRVIRTHGTELQPSDALVRGLASVFSLAALGIGCFWMLQDPESQTWHDKIAGTLVVKVPRDQVMP